MSTGSMVIFTLLCMSVTLHIWRMIIILMFITLLNCASSEEHFKGGTPCNFDARLSSQEKNQLESCGDGFCLCNETFAICAGHRSNLTYIPMLGATINTLNFSHNWLDRLDILTFININISNIKQMWLRKNYIKYLEPGIFTNFTHIRLLDLRQNNIFDYSLSLPGLSSSKLQCLALSHVKGPEYPPRSIKFVQGLIYTDSDLTLFNSSRLNLTHLQSLDVSYNYIYYLSVWQSKGLVHLNASGNSLKGFPKTCQTKSMSSLETIDLNNNYIEKMTSDEVKCLTSLSFLNLNNNWLSSLLPDTFYYLSNLKSLYINDGFGYHGFPPKMKASALNNTSLLTLNLKYIRGDFKLTVSKYAFHGCRTITHLDVSHNRMDTVDNDYLVTLLGDLNTIQILNLDNCSLSTFPAAVSERMPNIRELYLSSNRIVTIEPASFDELKQLVRITLAQNFIRTIPDDAFPLELRYQLLYVNLSNNTFSCTCDLLWLIQWMKLDSRKFIGYPYDYTCVYSNEPTSILMSNAPLSDQICSLSEKTVHLILSITVLVILSFVLTVVLYRWRWFIRYYIHMLRYRRRRNLQNEDGNEYTYDAFVLFCDDDFRFVRDRLMPEIEEQGQMRLCIHHRDFTPGTYIVDNIIKSLESSRNKVLILSNAFNESSWCEFELTLVHKRALEKQEGYLVVILLEDLKARNMTSSLYALLQTTTYITWPEEDEDREIFWQRVRASIKHHQ